MTETPKCPYCGAELEVTHAFVSDATAAHKLVYTCFCRECGVYTPKRSTPEEAISAALHRAEPENHPLTLEEIIAELENKELDVVWVECTVLMGAVPMFPSHRHGDTAFFFAPMTRQACTETLSNYGKTWRCWPRKPTPEQMAAEKWEE